MAGEKPKIGAGHAAAMGRLGLKELRNAVTPSKEGIADSEIGLYGTMTQGEIAQARGSYAMDPEQEKTPEAAGQTQDPGQTSPEVPGQEKPQEQTAGPTQESQAQSNTHKPAQTSPEVAQEMARMQGNEQSRSRGR